MNALVALFIGLGFALLGYNFYAKRVDREVIGADPRRATPATMFMDGVDFTPASKNVLFGYQFKSIAALGPIVGPIIAAQWGWLPGLLWILGGCAVIGWVQDYSSTAVAMRNEGQTFGGLTYRLISPRSRVLLLTYIYFYLLLVMGGFGVITAQLLTNPKTPLGFVAMTLAGILAGQMIYKWKKDIVMTTVLTVAISLGGIVLGITPAAQSFFTALSGGEPSPVLWGSGATAVTLKFLIWSLITYLFCYLGAVLPIWRFAQPINFVSFWIVAMGIVGAYIGVIIWRPSFADFPAFTQWSIGIGPLWPILFLTIACSAVSGWHSLVGSSGTARQIEKETDALPVAGGAMYMESLLGILSLIIAAATFGGFQGYKAALAKGPGFVFAGGMGSLLSYLGVPKEIGVAYGSVFLVIMAITVLQLVLRFMRVASAEFVGDKVPIMKNAHVGSFVGVVLALLLAWTGWWQRIWILFGGANQLMGALALLIVSVWLLSTGKSYKWVFYPFCFLYVTTIAGMLYTAWAVFAKTMKGGLPVDQVIGNVLAGCIALFLVISALILAWDGLRAMAQVRAKAVAAPAQRS